MNKLSYLNGQTKNIFKRTYMHPDKIKKLKLEKMESIFEQCKWKEDTM